MNLYSFKNKNGEFEIIRANQAKSGYEKLPDQYTLADMPYISVTEEQVIEQIGAEQITKTVRKYSVDSASKDAAEAARDKERQVSEAYDLMNKEVFEEMEKVFETSRADSATAYFETWKHMKENPSYYSSKGLKVSKQIMNADGTELFDEGALLDTDQKIIDFSSRKLELAYEYGIWRAERIQQFKDYKQSLLGG